MDKDQVESIISQLKSSKTDNQFIEVKEAVGKLPKSTVETISAFANGSGGTFIFGLSERENFIPAKGFNAKKIADAVAQACCDKLTPPIRANIEIVKYDNSEIVVASIDETLPRDKPCYVSTRGMYQGSFIRTFDGDRHLSQYEIDRLLGNKNQYCLA